MNRFASLRRPLVNLTFAVFLATTVSLVAQGTRNDTPAIAETWRWNDLVNRPERWAPEVTLKRELEFDDNTRVTSGTTVRIRKVTAREVEVILPDGTPVALDPADTDLLAAANRYWATLSPEQRAVNLAALTKDRSLMPPIVMTHIPLSFQKAPRKPGDEVVAADLVKQDLHVWSTEDGQALAISPMETDLLVRARALAALPPEKRVKAKWGTDYTAALALAKQEERKVFLFFTGSDWCGWCMRLEREILRMPEFTDFAAENLVLVKIDFPRRTRLPAAEAAQNQRLAQQYGVRGYPTVIILNSDGETVGDLGYQEGGPKPFIRRIAEL